MGTLCIPKAVSRRDRGFSLVELLVVIAILGIIVAGLQQAITSALTAYDNVKDKQELEAQARYAMERMVMFVQESDEISKPDSASDQEVIEVSERLLDTYNNTTWAYDVDGDGLLDADNDGDGIVNEDAVTPDPPDILTFDLDKTDSDNWKLREKMPDYSTPGDLTDFLSTRVLCENVTAFKNNLVHKNDSQFHSNMIEIELTLSSGVHEISLNTRARARLID